MARVAKKKAMKEKVLESFFAQSCKSEKCANTPAQQKKFDKRRLFLFHDDIEEFLVVAHSKENAFHVIESSLGSDAADSLILARLDEYPANFKFADNRSAKAVAKALFKGQRGYLHGDPGYFKKAPSFSSRES